RNGEHLARRALAADRARGRARRGRPRAATAASARRRDRGRAGPRRARAHRAAGGRPAGARASRPGQRRERPPGDVRGRGDGRRRLGGRGRSLMAGRRAARRTALFLLYQWDLTRQPLASLYEGEADPFALELAQAVAERAPELDERINAAADEWTADRMGV